MTTSSTHRPLRTGLASRDMVLSDGYVLGEIFRHIDDEWPLPRFNWTEARTHYVAPLPPTARVAAVCARWRSVMDAMAFGGSAEEWLSPWRSYQFARLLDAPTPIAGAALTIIRSLSYPPHRESTASRSRYVVGRMLMSHGDAIPLISYSTAVCGGVIPVAALIRSTIGKSRALWELLCTMLSERAGGGHHWLDIALFAALADAYPAGYATEYGRKMLEIIRHPIIGSVPTHAASVNYRTEAAISIWHYIPSLRPEAAGLIATMVDCIGFDAVCVSAMLNAKLERRATSATSDQLSDPKRPISGGAIGWVFSVISTADHPDVGPRSLADVLRAPRVSDALEWFMSKRRWREIWSDRIIATHGDIGEIERVSELVGGSEEEEESSTEDGPVA